MREIVDKYFPDNWVRHLLYRGIVHWTGFFCTDSVMQVDKNWTKQLEMALHAPCCIMAFIILPCLSFFVLNVVLKCLFCLPAGYQYLHGDHGEPGGGLGTVQSCQDRSQLHLRFCKHQRTGIQKFVFKKSSALSILQSFCVVCYCMQALITMSAEFVSHPMWSKLKHKGKSYQWLWKTFLNLSLKVWWWTWAQTEVQVQTKTHRSWRILHSQQDETWTILVYHLQILPWFLMTTSGREFIIYFSRWNLPLCNTPLPTLSV